MRLLHVRTLEFREFQEPHIPKYVITSHRWKGGEEVSFKDVRKRRKTDTYGYKKVKGFADFVRDHIADVEWFWIDTCCINQDSSHELSTAINSMFKWYQDAVVCIAWLEQVPSSRLVGQEQRLESFRDSVWFRRGWTLQELLAPCTVVFLSGQWDTIGHKREHRLSEKIPPLELGPSLVGTVAEITGLSAEILTDYQRSKSLSYEERLGWMANRETTVREDMVYCLLGIFEVHMPLIYGEGERKAQVRLREQIEGASTRNLPSRSLPPPARPSNVPFRPDPNFVERGNLLDRIDQRLCLPAGRVALAGLGGIGKSQLAIEHCYRLRQRSPDVWVFWIHGSNADRFELGMREIANTVKLAGREDANADINMLLQGWLCDPTNGKWLIVLDNVDNVDYLLESPSNSEESSSFHRSKALFDFLPQSEHGCILITTRNKQAAMKLVELEDIIAVERMHRDEAVQLMRRKLGGHSDDQESVEKLADALEYMPLALAQASAYIVRRRPRCSAEDFLKKLHKSEKARSSLLNQDSENLRRDKEASNSILLTWQISFDHMRQTQQSAADLLSLMSMFDRNGIPASLLRLRSTSAHCNASTTNEAGRDSDADSQASDSDTTADTGFEDDLATLLDYSFVTLTKDQNIFEMHRLMQLATRSWLKDRGRLERWKGELSDILCRVFPAGSKYENWDRCRVLYPHAKSALEMKPGTPSSLLQWASLLHNAAEYADDRGLASDARKMCMRSMEARLSVLDAEDEPVLSSTALLAVIEHNAGNWTAAEALGVRTLEIEKRVLEEEHPNTLSSINNLAFTFWKQGRWNEAAVLQVRLLETRKRVLGEEHPETLTSTNNLALTFSRQGRWNEAEALQLHLLETQKRVLGEEHPDTLISIGNLAFTYSNQGRWNEAEALQVQGLETEKRVLSDEHPDTLTSMNNLASTFSSQGRQDEAVVLLAQVLGTQKRVIGDEHPHTLTSMDNLAHIYQLQGEPACAITLMMACVAQSFKTLGEEHPAARYRSKTLETWRRQQRTADGATSDAQGGGVEPCQAVENREAAGSD